MRFHVVGLPHTKVNKDYLPCAYTQKVLNFCKMMRSLGHEVFLYAGEGSDETLATEFIPVISDFVQEEFFGHTDWKKDFFPIEWDANLPYWRLMNENTIKEMKSRIQPKDFICVIAGLCQKPIADAFPENVAVEFGIGYQGTFSKYRVFESYAHMHYLYGKQGTENGQYYDCVIPNYFDPQDFPPLQKKEDYFLFIGRMVSRKGPNVAAEACKIAGARLIMAGQGVIENKDGKIVSKELTIEGDNIKHIGTVGVKERGMLMAKAKAVFVQTQYIGPFEGVSIEANFCGTPVITTDWGCFAENVVDGLNGYRTRTMGEILWAMKNIDELSPWEIRKYANDNFSIDRVKYLYQAYFEQLMELWGEGWYSKNYDASNRRYRRYV